MRPERVDDLDIAQMVPNEGVVAIDHSEIERVVALYVEEEGETWRVEATRLSEGTRVDKPKLARGKAD